MCVVSMSLDLGQQDLNIFARVEQVSCFGAPHKLTQDRAPHWTAVAAAESVRLSCVRAGIAVTYDVLG